jgi:hypothetical protein
MYLIVGLLLSVAGCAGGGGTAPEPADESLPTETFISHMHAHADQLDKINYALADGDLYGAMTPAYWLSRHDDVSGIPAEWRPYMTGMRDAARDLENADNLTVARAAAERINEQCQGCHLAAGIR